MFFPINLRFPDFAESSQLIIKQDNFIIKENFPKKLFRMKNATNTVLWTTLFLKQ